MNGERTEVQEVRAQVYYQAQRPWWRASWLFTGQAIGLAGGPKDSNKNTVPPLAGDVPDVAPQARVMADQRVLVARSQTLEKLGEHRDAEAPRMPAPRIHCPLGHRCPLKAPEDSEWGFAGARTVAATF